MPTSPAASTHLHIGVILFPQMDQMDFTGPFEVLSRLPNATVHVLGKEKAPFRDARGMILTPEKSLSEAPPLDVLQVPGGYGQEALMDDEAVLSFIREHAGTGKWVFSICTGALICGAAGILKGRRVTTHWTAFHLLEYFGAVAVDQRVVVDGNLFSAAGVSSGIDGALKLASLLRGEEAAREIQLYMEYAPQPPFDSGSPRTASPQTVAAVRSEGQEIAEARLATAKRVAARLGVDMPPLPQPPQSSAARPDDEDAAAGSITLPSNHPAGATLDRLEGLLARKNIHVFARIDHAAGAESVGLPLRATQVLLFGNPQAGTPLMQSNQAIGIDLPLKALAWEDAAGRSWLTYDHPQYLAGRHGIRDRDRVVNAMSALLHDLATAATSA